MSKQNSLGEQIKALFNSLPEDFLCNEAVCDIIDQLEKDVLALLKDVVCIKRKRLERSLETLKGDSMDGAVMSVIDFRRFIEELLMDAPQKELKK